MTGRGKRSVAEEALTAGTWGGDVHMQFSVKTGTVDVVMAQSGEEEWHCLSQPTVDTFLITTRKKHSRAAGPAAPT